MLSLRCLEDTLEETVVVKHQGTRIEGQVLRYRLDKDLAGSDQ